MSGAFQDWSLTAGANATADPTINFSEGMSPSAVNDSCRAIMAALASYRDDISGALLTTGTATAFLLTTNQGFDATPNTGQLIAFTPHTTNGVNPTLACDGGTAYPIQQAVGTAVGSGTLVQGTPYAATFTGTVWLLHDFYGNPYAIPLGGMLFYTGTTAPNSNFALPYGQAISRTTYAPYFSQVGTTFGVGDGVNTFNILDIRGRGVSGLDNLGGTPASRLTTTYFGSDPTVLGNVGGQQNRTVNQANLPAATLATTTTINDPGHLHSWGHNSFSVSGGPGGGVGATGTFDYGVTSASVTGITATSSTQLGGSGTPLATVQPTILLPFILRIL